MSWGTVEDLKVEAEESGIQEITPFLCPVRAIVLFYRGRRRTGDVAHFCEMRVARCVVEEFRIAVCVVDMVHGPSHDISRGAANLFRVQTQSGRVAATGAASPCETLAIARWADHGWHSRTSPVPFRSAFALWGRHDLTPNEQRQVRPANVMLVYVIAFAALSAVCGIANWTEHPVLLIGHSFLFASSIWLTDRFRRLQVLPNVHSHRLKHCTFGCKTRKPTRLLTVNMEQ